MSSIRITQPVGLGGTNSLNDVKTVQTALNKLLKLIPPTQTLIVDGRLNPRSENSKTIAAIKLFQSKVLNMVRPDGKINPNDATFRKINEKLALYNSQKAGMKDPQLFLKNIIKPTLLKIGLSSKKAEILLLGTAIQESRLKYRQQLGGGPALSYFQIEPATHDDIWDNYLSYRGELALKVKSLMTTEDKLKELKENDAYACAIARIHYLRAPAALPEANDANAQAQYWKTYYNTPLGKGTVQEFIHNWQTYGVSI